MRVAWLSELEPAPSRDGAKPQIRVEILRTGSWLHPTAPNRELRVTREMLREVQDAFERGLFGYELPVNLNHSDDAVDAVGWVRRLEMDDAGERLFAWIEPTASEVFERVRDGRLRYASAELVIDGLEPESRRQVTGLRAVALTNRPYIKRMSPAQVVALSELPPAHSVSAHKSQARSVEEKTMQDLREQVHLLMERQREAELELLLSDYADRVPPAVIRVARALLQVISGDTVTLSELHATVDSQVLVHLSEGKNPNASVPAEDLVLLMLEEMAAVMPTRARVGLSESPYRTVSLSGDAVGTERMTRELIRRAETLAAERGIAFSEAVKQITREGRY